MEQSTTVEAEDGAPLPIKSFGSGPGVVLVHGGGVTASMYRRLAHRLSERSSGRLTVHLYNRRGRADAPPRREPYQIGDDVADLVAVLRSTGSTSIIGHSSGGFIALTAARQVAVERLVLYDAAINVDGGFPTDWIPAARAAATSGDLARCMALTSAGINSHLPVTRIPLSVQVLLCRVFMRTSIGATMAALLPTTLDESQQIADHSGDATEWADIDAEVLLTYGAAGPRYYRPINEALAAAIPSARLTAIKQTGHDGINRAPAVLVDTYAQFLA